MSKAKQTKEIVKEDDVLSLLQQAGEMEEENSSNLSDGNRVPFIKCIASAEAAELDPSSESYIKGAKYKGFCVPRTKTNLGPEFECTVLGVFKMYEDKIEPENKKALPKIVGYHMPAVVETSGIPVGEGTFFDRPYIDKQNKLHKISPVFWVFVLLSDQPDAGLHQFIFRSTANENVKKLNNLLKNLGGHVPQHVLNVVAEKKEFPNYNSVTYRALFEKTGKVNFEVNAKGKMVYKEMNKEETAETVKLFNKLQSDYNEGQLVAKRDLAESVLGLPAPGDELSF